MTTTITAHEVEEQAREDITQALEQWERDRPLSWKAEEMLDYWSGTSNKIRAQGRYAAAIRRLLPPMLAAERKGFEQRAAGFYVARISYPGTSTFTYSVHTDIEAAHDAIEAYRANAATQAELTAAHDAGVMRGQECLWDTWRDGTLIYRDLLAKL